MYSLLHVTLRGDGLQKIPNPKKKINENGFDEDKQ